MQVSSRIVMRSRGIDRDIRDDGGQVIYVLVQDIQADFFEDKPHIGGRDADSVRRDKVMKDGLVEGPPTFRPGPLEGRNWDHPRGEALGIEFVGSGRRRVNQQRGAVGELRGLDAHPDGGRLCKGRQRRKDDRGREPPIDLDAQWRRIDLGQIPHPVHPRRHHIPFREPGRFLEGFPGQVELVRPQIIVTPCAGRIHRKNLRHQVGVKGCIADGKDALVGSPDKLREIFSQQEIARAGGIGSLFLAGKLRRFERKHARTIFGFRLEIPGFARFQTREEKTRNLELEGAFPRTEQARTARPFCHSLGCRRIPVQADLPRGPAVLRAVLEGGDGPLDRQRGRGGVHQPRLDGAWSRRGFYRDKLPVIKGCPGLLGAGHAGCSKKDGKEKTGGSHRAVYSMMFLN